jgi:hypothetical protein
VGVDVMVEFEPGWVSDGVGKWTSRTSVDATDCMSVGEVGGSSVILHNAPQIILTSVQSPT